MSDKKLLHERLRDFANLYGDNVSVRFEDYFNMEAYDAKKLADEIERDYIPRKEAETEKRQIIEAQADSAHHTVKLYAENAGMPMEDGENITKWLDRWFIPRPRFKDGEPVKEGDEVEGGIVHLIKMFDDGSWRVENALGRRLCCGNVSDYAERPISKVLDADGVPIKVGDTVWCTKGSQLPLKVARIGLDPINGKDMGVFDENDTWCRCGIITHKESDTQEKIDADKKKLYGAYWGCELYLCDECPSCIDGKTPKDYYGVRHCSTAQGLDIARRQAMLDGCEE